MKNSLKFSNAEKILLGAGFSKNEIIPLLSNLQNPDTFEGTKNKLIIAGLDYVQMENLKTFSSEYLSSLVSSSDIPMVDIINQKYRSTSKESIIDSINTRENYEEKSLASNQNLKLGPELESEHGKLSFPVPAKSPDEGEVTSGDSASPDSKIWLAKTDIQKVKFEGGTPVELDDAFKQIKEGLLDDRPLKYIDTTIDALRLLSSFEQYEVVDVLIEILNRHRYNKKQVEMKNELRNAIKNIGLG